MAIATLTIDIDARLANLQTQLDKAAQQAEKSGRRMESAFAAAGSAIAALGVGIGTAALALKFDSIVNGFDKFNDIADITGATVENLSKLESVARRTGQDFDQVGDVLGKFANKLTEVGNPASDVSKALKAIGLSANDLKGLDTAEQFQKVAQALAGYADGGDKVAIVQALMTKSGKDLLPYIKDLGQAGELNATVTTAQAEAAERYKKQMAQLTAQFDDFSRTLVSKVLPALNGVLERFNATGNAGTSWRKQFQEAFRFGNDIEDNVAKAEALSARLTKITEQRAAAEAKAAAKRDSDPAGARGFAARARELQAEEDAARYELNTLKKIVAEREKIQGITSGTASPAKPLDASSLSAPGGSSDADKAAAKLKAESDARAAAAARYIADLNKQQAVLQAQIGSVDTLSASEKKLAEFHAQIADGTLKLTDAEKLRAEALIVSNADLEKSIALRADETKATQAQLDALIAETAARDKASTDRIDKALYGSTADERKQMADDIAQLQQRMQDGAITADEYARAIQNLTGQTKAAGDASKEASLYGEVLRDAFGRTADVFAEFATGGKADFSDFTQSLLKDMAALIAKKALMDAAFGSGKEGDNGVVGLISTAVSSYYGGGRATGGAVNDGKFYQVNERGPELLQTGGKTYLMGANGNVVPLRPSAVSAGAAGGVVQNINVTVQRVDGESADETAARIAGALRKEMRSVADEQIARRATSARA